MELPGHVGVALLVSLPVAYLLVARDRRRLCGGLAVLFAAAVVPDVDLYVAEVVHRGPTHTVWAALAVGGLLALPVALAGCRRRGVDGQPRPRGGTPSSESAADATLAVGGRRSWFVPAVGVLGVASHLLGDVLTPMGIRPFAPVVSTTYTLSLTSAADPVANAALLTLGVVAFCATLALGRRRGTATSVDEGAHYGDGVAGVDRHEA